jgi:hypothetical protein
VYQHDPPGASGFDAPKQEPFQKFAGAELEDFLLAKALECFAYGWSLSETQSWVSDWHWHKARAGAFLDDAEVEAIVARAEKVEKIAGVPHDDDNVVDLERARPSGTGSPSRTITIDRPGYTGTPLEVTIYRG